MSHLALIHLSLSELHQAAHFGGDAEVFKEALVGGPKLAPEGLTRDQSQHIRCPGEHFQRFSPLGKSRD